MRDLMNSAGVMRSVKKEPIVMDLDDEDVLCGEVKQESMMDVDNLTDTDEVVSAASGDDWETKIDHQYRMLLDSFREDRNSYLSDNPLRCIRYEVDNGGYDKRELKNKRSRDDLNSIRVTKKNVEPKPHVHVQASAEKTKKEAGFELRRRESLLTEKSVEAMLVTSHVKRNSQHDVDACEKEKEKENSEKTKKEAAFELRRRESVEAMLVTRNSQHDVDACEQENSENPMVLDECYKSYLIWFVANSKSSRTDNTEKEIQVKCEEDIMSLSDSDSDSIVVEDRPFLDEEDSPFVPSKSYKVIDLDEESSDQRSSWFRKEVINILNQPYTEKELMELHNEASVRRYLTRCRELRYGRESIYETKKRRPSYLDGYPDFKRKYLESVHERDSHKALNLLRGFMFYLTNMVREGAFKPWLDHECLKITCSDKRLPAL